MKKTICILVELLIMAAMMCCLTANAAEIGEPDIEGARNSFGLNLPMDAIVYIPETVSSFSFGDIHVDTGCAIAPSDLISVTLEEALGQDLEPCMSCAYRPSSEDADIEQTEFPYAYLGLAPEDAAYIPDGEDFYFYFHFSAECSRLNGSAVREITMREAANSGSACEICMPDSSQVATLADDGTPVSIATGEALVYYTANGAYFHITPNCSGMRNAQLHTAKNIFKSGKRHCPVCIADNVSRYWLPVPRSDADSVYFASSNKYYHRSFECFDMKSVTVGTRGEVKNYYGGFAPCPVCLPELGEGLSGERCWTSADDKFYHAASNCSKMAGNAAEMYAAEAQAAGKIRCHACAGEAAPAEYADRFAAAFGSELNAAYPGFIFERAETMADGSVVWYVSTAEDATPNVWEACTLSFSEEDGRLLSITLGGSFNSVGPLSAAFLEGLPDSIRVLFDRSIVDGVLEAMKSPDPNTAAAFAANVVGIALSFDKDGGIESCTMTFENDYSTIELGWRLEAGEYRLCNVQPLGDGWK